MPVDFEAIRAGKTTYAEQVKGITYKDLYNLTDQLFQKINTLTTGLDDKSTTFIPDDPEASEGDGKGWNIAHILVHLTASLEEAAATAVTLARGVALNEGQRLRYETPWETVTTAAQVKARLSESARMCKSLLDAWPDQPHMDVTVLRVPFFGPMNAIGAYMLGIGHAEMHYEQIARAVRQAKEA